MIHSTQYKFFTSGLKVHLSACLVLLVIVFLVSCEYDPNGKYFKVVEEKGPSPVTVKIDNSDSLISIWQSSSLNYDISPYSAQG